MNAYQIKKSIGEGERKEKGGGGGRYSHMQSEGLGVVLWVDKIGLK